MSFHGRYWATLLIGTLVGCAAPQAAPDPVDPVTPQQTVQVGDTTVLAVSPAPQPCCKKPTLPEFLGLNRIGAGIRGIFQRLFSRIRVRLGLVGRFPGLQAAPPVLPLTDPENLAENSPPAVKAAAEVKAEEDAAPQKVQALRYLASVGCGGCYPTVEEALLAALDDCTEEVRYAALDAMRTANGNACKFCTSTRCCSDNIRRKLDKIAYDQNDDGCFKEPSDRVRRLARILLCHCGGGVPEEAVPEEGPEDVPDEGPEADVAARLPDLFDGIQLVSFEQPVARNADDILLAEVNGEPIYESQIARLVDRMSSSGRDGRRAAMRRELYRMIDWTVLIQQARREMPNRQVDSTTVSDWMRDRVPVDEHVSDNDILEFYRRHQPRFHQPEAVRWERISIRIADFANAEDAHRTIAWLRNRAMGSREPPPAGFNAVNADTRTYGWVSRDKFPARLFADQAFRVPIGQVSPVLEVDGGLHLIRVLARRPARVAPLDMVSGQIRREMLQRRRLVEEQRFIERLRSKAQVWTVYDGAVRQVGFTQPVAARGVPQTALDAVERLPAP